MTAKCKEKKKTKNTDYGIKNNFHSDFIQRYKVLHSEEIYSNKCYQSSIDIAKCNPDRYAHVEDRKPCCFLSTKIKSMGNMTKQIPLTPQTQGKTR